LYVVDASHVVLQAIATNNQRKLVGLLNLFLSFFWTTTEKVHISITCRRTWFLLLKEMDKILCLQLDPPMTDCLFMVRVR
jgi:hypothetical protein